MSVPLVPLLTCCCCCRVETPATLLRARKVLVIFFFFLSPAVHANPRLLQRGGVKPRAHNTQAGRVIDFQRVARRVGLGGGGERETKKHKQNKGPQPASC